MGAAHVGIVTGFALGSIRGFELPRHEAGATVKSRQIFRTSHIGVDLRPICYITAQFHIDGIIRTDCMGGTVPVEFDGARNATAMLFGDYGHNTAASMGMCLGRWARSWSHILWSGALYLLVEDCARRLSGSRKPRRVPPFNTDVYVLVNLQNIPAGQQIHPSSVPLS
jgi:hypothetical protein